ncbi:uncharacterized protein B0I36DRAFT_368107 [Microdochium trichocladiopsis]|uniref:Uncharacterized protein n=1 Tax=Microdochium trichocladiopsis TaxID=1682393 RepID=A0A9P8XX16_9PEZI|nr:uncharacterized protein B0I36DRAFT_368107 [Microdochium trichocladiopsis]KAH7018057.1 hypothetical protein B0I36DRAFT_368107 [Microdochium trichocladiopsis]
MYQAASGDQPEYLHKNLTVTSKTAKARAAQAETAQAGKAAQAAAASQVFEADTIINDQPSTIGTSARAPSVTPRADSPAGPDPSPPNTPMAAEAAFTHLLNPPRFDGGRVNDPFFAKWRAHCYLLHMLLGECAKVVVPVAPATNTTDHILPGNSWKFLTFRNRTKYTRCMDEFLMSMRAYLKGFITGKGESLLADWKLHLGHGGDLTDKAGALDVNKLDLDSERIEDGKAGRVYVTQCPEDVWHLRNIWLLEPPELPPPQPTAPASSTKSATTTAKKASAATAQASEKKPTTNTATTTTKPTMTVPNTVDPTTKTSTPNIKPNSENIPYDYTDPLQAIRMWDKRLQTHGNNGLTFIDPLLLSKTKVLVRSIECRDPLCFVCAGRLPPSIPSGQGRKVTKADLK